MAGYLRTERVLNALNTTMEHGQAEPVIHHAGRECECTYFAFGERYQR